MDELTPMDQEEEQEGDIEAIRWSAHEFEYHHKNVLWYLLLIIIMGALAVAAVITKQWLSIAVIVAVTLALVVFAARKPKELTYEIDEDGVRVGERHFPISQFQSFSIVSNPSWREVELDPIKRFMPRVSLSLAEDTGDDVLGVLAELLPRIDREPDFIEKWSRKLKF